MHEEHKEEESLTPHEALLLCAIREQLLFFYYQGFAYVLEVAWQMVEFRGLPPSRQRVWIIYIYNAFARALEIDNNAALLREVAEVQLNFIRHRLKRFLADEKWEAEEEKTPPLPPSGPHGTKLH